MKHLFLLSAATVLGLTVHAQDYMPSANRIQKTVSFLASDKLKGRGTGQKGSIKASRFVAAQFKKMGLAPGNAGSYYQDFTFDRNSHKGLTSRNVIGWLDNGAARTIIIGAHYDHLGTAELFDGKYPAGQIHNGADDNASGVAGLLEFVRYFTENGEKEPFNFLFLAFGGEEMGLQGSKYFTANPTLPLANVHFMLNMDMIGRYNDERGIGIGGYATAEEWPAVFKDVQEPGIHYFTDGSGKGASDHHNFFMNKVPVIFLHTGPHDDYHKPTDDAPKLKAKEEALILQLGIKLINNAMKYKELHYHE
ncbi:M20/M25/M40 family metallo-hydrolase [Chitinophaga tropicalis]|uniref:M20/M25/M40 family metallo-hydrolase n=1 Tax=Chitinophaga tropicalis TaxID=2683588 RepID=A0A7K1UBZ7_9BACT|nr:M20/M25/M40 family metallo-hydrolase [Chitinophaga tropicalis]MVT11495.1 M20/M25/M40 family metallo-hydrolase [Chitinophaga tropicalis]